jgi:DNA/RNA-binding protein KIN17
VARREDVKRKERQARGDEDLESRLLNQQIKRAKEAAKEKEKLEAEQRQGSEEAQKPELETASAEPVKLSLSLGARTSQKPADIVKEPEADAPVAIDTFSAQDSTPAPLPEKQDTPTAPAPAQTAPPKISLGGLMGKKPNALLGKRPNALAGKKPIAAPEPEKKMSNAERIMREEMERKRFRDDRGGENGKRQRLD